jgi:aspartyl-tRNA(Asn)/glutamyl-tRNA(Gln) amidotransferase subunit A
LSEAVLPVDARHGIAGLSRSLRSGQISAHTLTEEALERIELHNPALNAVVTVLADQAMAAARRADREIRSGHSRGPLHGIPIGLKDVIDARGSRTTAGSAFCRDHIADRDATVVRRLRRAGAVIVAKLHTQEFAYGATGEASFIGPSRNPHDLDRMTGGSSGGPAAAVASGMCVGALGTDTGGSIRIPSSLCGVVGLKPTMGRIGRTGVTPLSWTLDHVGPITRSVADNALLFTALCGFDPEDSASVRRRPEDFTRDLIAGVHGLRIGVPEAYFEHLEPEVRRCVDAALRAWGDLGATIRPVAVPELGRIVAAQRTVLAAEAYAVHRDRIEAHPELLQDVVRQRLRTGATLPAWKYAESYRLRDRAVQAFDDALADVDALATPTVPIPAPRRGRSETSAAGIREAIQAALTRLTGATNFTGHPSLTMPCGHTRQGLPVGVQLIGRRWQEAMLYRVGQALEAA